MYAVVDSRKGVRVELFMYVGQRPGTSQLDLCTSTQVDQLID